jgi:hypothetical protein
MITKALFSELLYDSQSERWTEFELPKLSLGELQALCKLLGCPCYGTKETLVVRLLAQRALRLKLAPFTDNAAELAASMRREALRDICREAGIWRSGNKRALAAGLINWRDRWASPMPYPPRQRPARRSTSGSPGAHDDLSRCAVRNYARNHRCSAFQNSDLLEGDGGVSGAENSRVFKADIG